MEVSRYEPNAAVMGDMDWISTKVKLWDSVINQWFWLRCLGENCINLKREGEDAKPDALG